MMASQTFACNLESITTLEALRWAFLRVKKNNGAPGMDGITIDRFNRNLDANLLDLRDEVQTGVYTPGGVRFVLIQEPGKTRRIAIPTVRDRVLQRAVLDRLEPIIDPLLLESRYAYRPGLSTRNAVERIVHLRNRGLTHVIDADIRKCFDTLDHQIVMQSMTSLVPSLDVGVINLIQCWLEIPVRERHHRNPLTRNIGILQGAPISPLLCNVYLHQFDASLKRRRLSLVRYADDFVVLCRSPEHADRAIRIVQKILRALRLSIHPAKTRITDFEQGFTFLGVHFQGSKYSYLSEEKRITIEDIAPDWFYYHPDDYGSFS